MVISQALHTQNGADFQQAITASRVSRHKQFDEIKKPTASVEAKQEQLLTSLEILHSEALSKSNRDMFHPNESAQQFADKIAGLITKSESLDNLTSHTQELNSIRDEASQTGYKNRPRLLDLSA